MTATQNGRHAPSIKNSPVEKLESSEQAPVRPYKPENPPDSPENSTTARERVQGALDGLIGWLRDFFVFPSFLVERPPNFEELSAYAHRNARLKDAPALVRGVLALWFYVVVCPTTIMARFKEWAISRFGRAFFFIGVAELFLRFTPMGHWIAAAIRGFYAALAWLLLP